MKTRNTVQKFRILEYVNNNHTHPNVDEVYNALKKDIPSITKGTIYRNLNQMAEEGKINRLTIGNEFRFDSNLEKHQHIVCRVCGKITDLHNPKISDYVMGQLNSDFKPDMVEITYKGICMRCKNENK